MILKLSFLKRNSFIVLLCAVSVVLTLAFAFILLGHKKNQSLQTLKTSCRLVVLDSAKETLSRIQKLNSLMDQPIDWVFKDLKEEVFDLYCFRGQKIIVLNFWATWCAPCVKELSSLSELAEQHEDELFVVAVSTESKEQIENFLSQSFKGLSKELKIASVDEKEKLRYFPKDSLPSTYIFNRQGFLKIKEVGDKDWSHPQIVKNILKLN